MGILQVYTRHKIRILNNFIFAMCLFFISCCLSREKILFCLLIFKSKNICRDGIQLESQVWSRVCSIIISNMFCWVTSQICVERTDEHMNRELFNDNVKSIWWARTNGRNKNMQDNFKIGIMLHILSSQTVGMFLSIWDSDLRHAIQMTKPFIKSTQELNSAGRNGRDRNVVGCAQHLRNWYFQAFGKSAKAFKVNELNAPLRLLEHLSLVEFSNMCTCGKSQANQLEWKLP